MSSVPLTSNVDSSHSRARQVAVIDIGSTSIRMAIADIQPQGTVRPLERLSQAVNLGRDTFTEGSIRRATVEECVRVLRTYKRKLEEYQIVQSDRIRVVATSAVREASNRLAFIDRIYIATGLRVEPLDETEANRITYLGVQQYLQADPALAVCKTIVAEVGGGSTELLAVRGGDVVYSHTFRLGSLRLRKTLERYRGPALNERRIMESQIKRTVEQVIEEIPVEGQAEMMAIGGDMRFATAEILPDWDRATIARVPVVSLEQFTDRILKMSEDKIVRKYHLAFPDAEALGPALLTYLHLARAFKLANVMVTNTNLRDGLLLEMAVRDAWSEQFRNQIIRSALDLGRRFDFDEQHGRRVAELARTLFDELRDEHQLDSRYEIILYIAALLCEIGAFVSTRSLHKHSMYLIRNSELFGLGEKFQLLVALVARYHRRASPQPMHEGYALLDRDDRVIVAKLAAVLRVALALDESRAGRVQEFHCRVDDTQLVISIPNVEDLSLEQLAVQQSGTLFEDVYGLSVVLRTVSPA